MPGLKTNPRPAGVPARVAARYARGELTGADVARLLDVSPPTALARLRAAGVRTAGPGRRRELLRIGADMLARYAAGELSTRQVARRYGVCEPTALRELRRAGADTSRSARQHARMVRERGAVWREAEALYRRGLDVAEVAARLRLSEVGVRLILARAGLEPSRRGASAGARRV